MHTYKVKIINPLRKSDVTVRHLHNISTRFECAVGLRMKLVEEFQELVPDSMSFNVRYFEGQNHAKIWLVAREDFMTMYRKYPKGKITLWCDGRRDEEEDVSVSRKRRKRMAKLHHGGNKPLTEMCAIPETCSPLTSSECFCAGLPRIL